MSLFWLLWTKDPPIDCLGNEISPQSQCAFDTELNTKQWKATTGFAGGRVQLLMQSIYTATTILLAAECGHIGGAGPNYCTATCQLIWQRCCTADAAVIARELYAAQHRIYTHHLGLVHGTGACLRLSLNLPCSFPCLVLTSTYCFEYITHFSLEGSFIFSLFSFQS